MRRIPRMTWENFPDNDSRQFYVGARDAAGYWIRRARCDSELACRQYFRFRLLRLTLHIDSVHKNDIVQARNSQKLDKWFSVSGQSDNFSASNDLEAGFRVTSNSFMHIDSACIILSTVLVPENRFVARRSAEL